MPTPKILIKSADRALICGKTGSGKTFLARYLTKDLSRLVVLDGKGTLSDWELTPWGPEARKDLLNGEPVRSRALPAMNEAPALYWDEVLEDCYTAGNVVIYIDELMALDPSGHNPSDVLRAVYTRGRELGVGVWASTQRPVFIPLFSFSESEHIFVFRLSIKEDRARLAGFVGPEVFTLIRDPHGFFYSYSTWEAPIYVKQLEVKEEKTVEVKSVVAEPPEPVRPGRSRKLVFSGGK